jgi:hypothetical protein
MTFLPGRALEYHAKLNLLINDFGFTLDFRSLPWLARDSEVGVEDEGLVYPLFGGAGHGADGSGKFRFALQAGACLVYPDGPFVGGPW